MYGRDYEYARSRIAHTILCLDSGEPVYIHDVDLGNGLCSVNSIAKEDDEIKLVSLDKINCKPPRLGFVNTRGVATYVSRMPLRRDWKQGLRRENMSSSTVPIREVKWSDLANCILNKYPKLDKAYESISKQGSPLKSIAFHRHWALTKFMDITYKGSTIVGKFDPKTFEITLNESYNHLYECLQESL